MNQQDVFKKIGGILKELNDQYSYLQNDTTQLNELELELFVANAHFLKDHSEILRKINAQQAAREKPAETAQPALPPAPVIAELPPAQVISPEPPLDQPAIAAEPEQPLFKPEPPKPEPVFKAQPPEPLFKPEPARPEPVFIPEPVRPVSEEKFFEPMVQQLKPVLNEEPAKVVEPPYINSEAQQLAEAAEAEDQPVRHQLVMDEQETWEDDEPEIFEEEEVYEVEEPVAVTPPAPPVKPEPVPEPKAPEPQPQPVPEAVKPVPVEDSRPLTINQIMSGQVAERKSQTQQPVTDLKSAITLNDKLLFVKDLFNGYSLAYSEAVEILNRFNSFDEAERFLNTNYVAKNNWATKTSTADKFYDLLRRRYS